MVPNERRAIAEREPSFTGRKGVYGYATQETSRPSKKNTSPRAPKFDQKKIGAKKRLRTPQAITRRVKDTMIQRPRIGSFDPHAHQPSHAELRKGRKEREGHRRAYKTLP